MRLSRLCIPVVFSALLLLTGCVKIWQDTLDIRTYMMTAERDAQKRPVPMGEKLWIDHAAVLPPYNGRSLILRKDDVEFTTSYYTELLMPPAENFRNEFYKWFQASGVFQDVSVSGRDRLSHSLQVSVVEFYADTSKLEAVLTVKVSLIDEKARELRVLMNREYKQALKIDAPDAAPLIRAYNESLKNILKACENDVVSALKRKAHEGD